MEQEFKTVASYNDAMSAEITASMLRANGIPAEVFNETSSFAGFVDRHGITVKVNAGDYDEALSLIAAADKAE